MSSASKRRAMTGPTYAQREPSVSSKNSSTRLLRSSGTLASGTQPSSKRFFIAGVSILLVFAAVNRIP